MRREDLGDLAAFLAVADARSFTRAAAQLGTSQSALSHTLRRLEARLGLRLLVRTTRSVAPTEAGERLIETLRPALNEIDHRITALAELRDRPSGTIRITSGEHAAHTILWPVLSKLLPRYPEIRVEIATDQSLTDIVAGRLRRRGAARRTGGGRHDRGADRTRHADGGGRFALLLCARASPAENAARPDWPHLHQPAPADPRRPLCLGVREGRPRAQCPGRGPAGVQRHEPDREGAEAGLGLAYVMPDQVADQIADGRLIPVLEDWRPPFPGYHLYYPSRRQPTSAFALVVDALRWRGPSGPGVATDSPG
jgi:DNA-binding transcriptional LysR family regulator